MKTDTFTVWNKPDSGPLTVEERDAEGGFSFIQSEAKAKQRANDLKSSFPHMDFLVRKEDANGLASIVLDTSEQSKEAAK